MLKIADAIYLEYGLIVRLNCKIFPFPAIDTLWPFLPLAPGATFATETGSASEVVAATPGAHGDFQVGTKIDFEKQHLLLQPGVGIVIKLGQK